MLGHVWPTLKGRGLSGNRGSEVKPADLWPIVCFTELEAKSMLDKLLAAELLDIVVLLKTYFGFSFQKVSPITNTNRTRKSTTYLMSVQYRYMESDVSRLPTEVIFTTI